MKKMHSLIIVLILFLSCSPDKTQIVVESGTLIENVTVITCDSEGKIFEKKGNVLLDLGVIKTISKTKLEIKGNFQRVNGKDKFLIPGLIDSHVHLNNIPGLDHRERANNPELVQHYFERLPLNFLYYGYTSVIDVDNYAPEVIQSIKKSSLRPNIFTCGAKIQVMDDFEMVINEVPQKSCWRMPFLYDYYKQGKVPDSINIQEHSASFLVEKIHSECNNCIKVLYEDASSGLPQTWEKPSQQIIQDLVFEARKFQMPVILHAPSFEGQKFALETEVDIIAHAMWNWTPNPEKFLDSTLLEAHRELLEEIAKRKIGYQPTFRTLMGELDVLNGNFIDYQPLNQLYSHSFIEYLTTYSAVKSRNKIIWRLSFLERINPDFVKPIRSKFSSDEALLDSLYISYQTKISKVVKLIGEYNGNLLFGTDNGALNLYTHPPGLNGYLEMKHWKSAGIPLNQVFIAATYNNAKEFYLLDKKGTIEVGKEADLLLLNDNPLENIMAYDKIDKVIIKGEVINREALSISN
ncbi:amidohydrolase family protein [Flagellimonas sp. S174]|uniref:amidohydrolase family protein n=1 Tax=Flagellimonas sp. S174 TaxID=3410790 RepID=UPI003BF619C7